MIKHYFIFSLLSAMTASLAASAQNQGSFAYGYCTNDINGVGSDSGVSNYWIGGAFEMTASDVERFDGCEITGVSVGFGSGRNKAVTIFFTEKLDGEPFAIQEGRVRVSQWNDIELTQPVKIEKGKPFYVGYKHNVTNNTARPVGCDGNTANYTSTADWLSLSETENGLSSEWKHYGDAVGNVCLRVYVKGNNLPLNNCVPTSLVMPDLAYPGTPFDFTVEFSNASAAEVKEIQVEYIIGDDEPKTADVVLKTPVAPNGAGTASVNAVTDQDSFKLPVSARITKVNGNPNDMADRSISSIFTCTDNLFERKVVVEKFSGTSCGYCPRGIVGFDYMNETYPDKFIGISIQNYSTDDPMYCRYYNDALYSFEFTGAPNVIVDRDKSLSKEASKASIENSFKLEYTRACEIGVFADFEKPADGAKSVTVSGTVKVSHDVENADYSLTFVITEDKVGPYSQLNNYNSITGLPEWQGKGALVSMLYDDVARYIHEDWKGIAGSVPTTLKAGESYKYTVNDLPLGKTSNIANANVVVLLIDNATGRIVNADRKHFDPDRKPSGVDSSNIAKAEKVIACNGHIYYEGEGEARVYSAGGLPVGIVSEGHALSPVPGLYIVRSTTGVTKVLVR